MCGIAGCVFPPGVVSGPAALARVRAMTRRLAHRGPDGEGFACRIDDHGPNFALGMRRLALVDVSGGAQPLWDADGEAGIVFNGELYNHPQLRSRLERAGRRFRTESDTEVFLAAFLEWGAEVFHAARGVFAAAIVRPGQVSLLRDRWGVKPLYLHLRSAPGGAVRYLSFASEMKAVLADGTLTPRLNRDAVAEHAAFDFCLGGRTLLDGVEAFPPGEVWTIDAAMGLSKASRRRPAAAALAPKAASLEETSQALERALRTAVRRQSRDRPRSTNLCSGGLDSCVLADIAKDEGVLERIDAIGPRGGSSDLDQIAQLRKLGAFEACVVHRFGYADMLSAAGAVVRAEEQPASFHATAIHLLASRLRGQVRVAFSGEGADELFGGYPTFIRRAYFRRKLARALSLRLTGVPINDDVLRLYQDVAAAPDPVYCALVRRFSLEHALYPQHLAMADKHFMAHGIECRVPYLDDDVVGLALAAPMDHFASLLRGEQKVALKLAAGGIGLASRLGACRVKAGFPSAVSPYVRRACAQFSDYRGVHAVGDLAGVAPGRGLAALSFDIFHHHFIDNAGAPCDLPPELDPIALACAPEVSRPRASAAPIAHRGSPAAS